jgi:excisionase family DNA binding protein
MNSDRHNLLRVEEAAEFLNLKASTIRAWLLKRKLPAVRIGQRAIRIPRAALEKLITDGTVPVRERRDGR